MPIAIAALERGYAVDLYTGMAASPARELAAVTELSRYPITHWRLRFTSAGLNPVSEGASILELARRLRRRRPHILHCVTPKGVLYGGIASRLAGVPALVAAVSGQGYAFTDGEGGASRTIARLAYRIGSRYGFAHRNRRVIVQNSEDRRTVVATGLAPIEHTILVPGSGVDLPRFSALSMERKQPIVLLPARMLRDKGVCEFAEAARILRDRGCRWRFVLAGGADLENPSRVGEATLQRWQADGRLEWLGHVDDMPPLYESAAIVCLPSYREGLPKSLLEAAAAGSAVITSDVAGCREAILPGESGDLVPPRDPQALAEALHALIADPERRERYGRAGRELARTRFGVERVVERTLAVYDDLLRQ